MLCLQALCASGVEQEGSRTAYVSLLYGATFVEAARVLGYSIRLTSQRYFLCSNTCSEAWVWRIYPALHANLPATSSSNRRLR